jgi:hypothetical protein
MPKDTLLVEWDPPLRREIGRYVRALGDAVVHGDDSREFLFKALHRLWECVAKAFDDLEHRQVGIAEPVAEEKGAPAAGDHVFEIPGISADLWKSAVRGFASCAGFRSRARPQSGGVCHGFRPREIVSCSWWIHQSHST